MAEMEPGHGQGINTLAQALEPGRVAVVQLLPPVSNQSLPKRPIHTLIIKHRCSRAYGTVSSTIQWECRPRFSSIPSGCEFELGRLLGGASVIS